MITPALRGPLYPVAESPLEGPLIATRPTRRRRWRVRVLRRVERELVAPSGARVRVMVPVVAIEAV